MLLEDVGHTLRGLFIIDNNSVLRQVTMNDLPVGRSVDETLRLVKAFQHTDTHGVVCPAGWNPGDDTVSHGGALGLWEDFGQRISAHLRKATVLFSLPI